MTIPESEPSPLQQATYEELVTEIASRYDGHIFSGVKCRSDDTHEEALSSMAMSRSCYVAMITNLLMYNAKDDIDAAETVVQHIAALINCIKDLEKNTPLGMTQSRQAMISKFFEDVSIGGD